LTGEGGALEEFAKSAAKDEEEIEHGAKEIAKAIAKIVKYPHSFSPDLGNEYRVRHEIFWARLFSQPEVFRGDYSVDSPAIANVEQRAIHNIMHASETPEEAQNEIGLWFKPEEIHSYKRAEEDIMF
jgi:hypothetical protein